MKIKHIVTILPAVLMLASCAKAGTPAPVQEVDATPVSSPVPTLPATLTPVPMNIPEQSTPTAIYTPVLLSPEDDAVYQKALADIPVNRQGDIRITVQDEKGSPLKGAQVKFKQVSHDFLFGGVSNNFDAGKEMQAGINSWVVNMGWNWIEPEYGKYNLDFINYWVGIDELNTGGMTVRTSGLYLFATGNVPVYYQDVPYDEFQKRLYEHVSTTVKRFAPAVNYWEAVLEPDPVKNNPLNLTKDEYYQAIGTSIKAIRDNDPTAKVEVNFGIPCGGLDWFDSYQTLQEMLERDLDFDLVGMQFYYNAYITAGKYPMPKMSLSEISACYDKHETLLSAHGKKISDTEFTVPSEAPAGQTGYWDTAWSDDTQAQYLDTAFTIFFSKPENLSLVWWNTFEPSPFVYHGGLVREDGTPKKSYYALQRLIESWTTRGETITDAGGTAAFRGFGGEYELEIVNPADGAVMVARVHVTEKKSSDETILFVPDNALVEEQARLVKLAAYWEAESDPALAQKGRDYLALVNHHIQNLERALAEQTLAAAFEDLAITTEVIIPNDKFIAALPQGGSNVIENGSNLIWGATTLHYPVDFPEGTVTVEITAHSHNTTGESPIMVAGAGANYSQVCKVEKEQPRVYTFTTSTTGREQELTIRFPYDGRIYERITAQNGEVGELKLFIDRVKLVVKTTEVP
jgi:GH35 family endo-1,4-beta-xylanase